MNYTINYLILRSDAWESCGLLRGDLVCLPTRKGCLYIGTHRSFFMYPHSLRFCGFKCDPRLDQIFRYLIQSKSLSLCLQTYNLDPWQDLTDNYGKGGYKRIIGLKQMYPHLKITLAIGGWNEGSENYSKLVKDPARRSRFIVSVVEFIRYANLILNLYEITCILFLGSMNSMDLILIGNSQENVVDQPMIN